MKHYKDAIIHGAQLFRHLKGQQTSDNELVLAKLPFDAARTSARALSRRAAAEEGVEEDDDFFSSLGLGLDESGGDFFSDFFGGDDDGLENFMENFEQCGIDVEEMTGKALGAFFSYGSGLDMSSPESFLGSDTYGPMLLALKDDDEKECSATDSANFLLASNEYLQCSGMNDFFDYGADSKEIEVLFQSFEDDCKPFFDMVNTGDILSLQHDILDEESSLGQSSKRCLQTFLGDNAMGNFIRYQYNHIDKTFGCFSKLGEDLPHCVLSLPVEDGDPMSLPLSLEKKLACVLGSSYESFIEEACVGMFEGLDKCLPRSDDATNVDDAISLCAGEEGILIGKQDDLLGMDASVVTDNKMPDFCSKVFKEKGMDADELQSRLEYYNKNREYGWTIESIVPESPEESQALYKSNPVGISSQVYSTWTDGEAAPEDDSYLQKKYLSFLVAGLVIAAAVLLALIVKYRRLGENPVRSHSTSNNNSRKDYATLSVQMAELA